MHYLFMSILADTPTIKPDYNFPGSSALSKVVTVIMGGIGIALVALFFVGLFKIVRSIGSHHEGGAGAGAALMIASAIALALLATGTSFLNQWISFFGG